MVILKPILKKAQSLWAQALRIRGVGFLVEVFKRFGKDNGGLLSAGLAFFLVLAFVPLLLVGLWILGQVYAHKPDEAVVQIEKLLAQIIPGGAAGGEVTHLMERAHITTPDGLHAGPTLLHILNGRGIAGLVGLLGVVWAASQIFVNGSVAMNAAWEVTEQRNWFRLHLVALGLLLATALLLAASIAATAISTSISASAFAKMVPEAALLRTGLLEIAAVAISAVMYAVTYKFLPSATVSWRAAFCGGIVAAVGWELAKKGLAVYLLKPNTSLYGELGSLIVFVLWIYYSMMILLLGAEAAALYAIRCDTSPLIRLKKAAALPHTSQERSQKASQKQGQSSRR